VAFVDQIPKEDWYEKRKGDRLLFYQLT